MKEFKDWWEEHKGDGVGELSPAGQSVLGNIKKLCEKAFNAGKGKVTTELRNDAFDRFDELIIENSPFIHFEIMDSGHLWFAANTEEGRSVLTILARTYETGDPYLEVTHHTEEILSEVEKI
jgi:hypothetical protein